MTFRFWSPPDDARELTSRALLAHPFRQLIVSLTSHCNLECWHCARSLDPRPGRSISKELCDLLLERLVPRARALRVGGNGLTEQMLSTWFEYFLERLDRSRMDEVHLITNLTALTARKAALVAEKVDNLEVSVEGTGAYFERVRGFPWLRMLANLEQADRARRTAGSRMQICLVVCVLKSHQANLLDLFRLRELGVDRMVFREFQSIDPERDGELLTLEPAETAHWIRRYDEASAASGLPIEVCYRHAYGVPLGPPAALPPAAPAQQRRAWRDCHFPWTTLGVDPDGVVSCCDFPLNLGRIVPGDGKPPGSVWNTRRFVELRRSVNSQTPPEPCRGCELKN